MAVEQEDSVTQHEGEVPAIRKLDESVVNRIAAGEVIQRPASALKEMLENSLDAGSTAITVTVKEGGNRMLQIQDNGHGIRKEDLPILCERFTTSKLRTFEDLEGINTLGFRGEALASISYVAHMTVTTMTADSSVAYRATYSDGVMGDGCPKPCASVKGTIILVEDLFFNVPLRKKGLKSATEEYNAILDVVGRYAVFKAGVAMTVKRQGEARADLHTLQGGSRLDAIRSVYGASVARNVLPLLLKKEAAVGEEDGVAYTIEGYVSGADYSGKKTTFVLFINGRSVDCTPLKRALEATYAAVLPKAAKPFVFLDVRLPGSHVDVNVHPTKREVGFLHQEELIDAVREGVEARLLASNTTRTFTQTLLPGAPLIEVPTNTPAPTYYRPDKLVRTDARAQTLHAFMPAMAGSQQQLMSQQAQQRVQQAQQGPAGAAGEIFMGAEEEEGGHAEPAGMEVDECGEDPQQQQDVQEQHERQQHAQQAQQGISGEERDEEEEEEGHAEEEVGAASESPHGAAPPSGTQAAATAATAAVAAAAAAPAARRRRGAPTGALAGGGEGAFAFMPTAMEISGAVQSGQSGAEPAGEELAPAPLDAGREGEEYGRVAEGQDIDMEDGDGSGPQHAQHQAQLAQRAGGSQGGGAKRRASGPVRHRANPSAAGGLVAVQRLLADAERSPHSGLSEILRSPTFVGMADEQFALVQHGTRLYLLDVKALSHDMFYQQALRRVGHCKRILLEPPPSIAELALAELEAQEAAGQWQDSEETGSKEEVAALLTELLQKKAGWLSDHFSIDVDDEGRLCSLPQLIEQYTPDLYRLPAFVLALAQRVEWGDEEECFRTLSQALADLYCVQPLLAPMPAAAAVGAAGAAAAARGDAGSAAGGDIAGSSEKPLGRSSEGQALEEHSAQQQEELRAREWVVQHVILPALRLFLKPGRARAGDGSIVELTRLENLYRIFERC